MRTMLTSRTLSQYSSDDAQKAEQASCGTSLLETFMLRCLNLKTQSFTFFVACGSLYPQRAIESTLGKLRAGQSSLATVSFSVPGLLLNSSESKCRTTHCALSTLSQTWLKPGV